VKSAMFKSTARPLHVLVPLIKEDLRQEKEAAAQAAMPFRVGAGAKMIEARDGNGLKGRELTDWTKRHFNLGRSATFFYMKLAEASGYGTSMIMDRAKSFTSMNDFKRHLGLVDRRHRRTRQTGGAPARAQGRTQSQGRARSRTQAGSAIDRRLCRDAVNGSLSRSPDHPDCPLWTQHPDKKPSPSTSPGLDDGFLSCLHEMGRHCQQHARMHGVGTKGSLI
jgi:hypothetical protein